MSSGAVVICALRVKICTGLSSVKYYCLILTSPKILNNFEEYYTLYLKQHTIVTKSKQLHIKLTPVLTIKAAKKQIKLFYINLLHLQYTSVLHLFFSWKLTP